MNDSVTTLVAAARAMVPAAEDALKNLNPDKGSGENYQPTWNALRNALTNLIMATNATRNPDAVLCPDCGVEDPLHTTPWCPGWRRQGIEPMVMP